MSIDLKKFCRYAFLENKDKRHPRTKGKKQHRNPTQNLLLTKAPDCIAQCPDKANCRNYGYNKIQKQIIFPPFRGCLL